MPIAACYIRVSTDDQLAYSPDSQLKMIQAYAQKQGLQLPQAFIFREDDGVSGRQAEKRPEFQRMIAIARQSPAPFEVILVWKFSRFARNQEESIVYKSLLRRQGVEVVSVSEPLAEGPFGGLIERIIEWMDEYYSANLSGEVRRGMGERRSQGLPVSAAPYGYIWREGGFEVDPEAAAIVRQFFQRFAAGEPVLQLTRWANSLGTGRVWENRTVQYLLQNPVYTGKLRTASYPFSHGQPGILPGRHEAIISDALWEQAQGQISRQKLLYRRHDHTANAKPRLYSGILRCSACGGALASGGKRDSWQCTRYAHGRCGTSHYTTTAAVTAAIWPAMRQIFGREELRLLLIPQGQEAAGEKQALQRRLAQAEARLRRAREAYESGVYTLSEYKASRSRIQQDRDQLETLLAQSPQPHPLERESSLLIKELLEILLDPQTDTLAQNSIFRSFVAKIVFHRTSNQWDLFYYL